MANECKVFQMRSPRIRDAPIRPVPFLDYDELSDDSVLTLGKSTVMVTIISSLDGTIDFEPTAGTTPDGTINPYPITADQEYDFDVKPGMRLRFDT